MALSLRTVAALLITAPVVAGAVPVDAVGAELFEKKVQPILREHCFKCHSHSSEKIKGGLVLDSSDGALAGGDSGPAIVPGDTEKSLLIEAVTYVNEDLQMPPKGKKLSDEQIATLTEWVRIGAPWPADPAKKTALRPKGKITDEDRQWWSFQPLSRPTPPNVEDRGWSENEVDRFVFARLQANGLQPAPRAVKTALIRRVYFDVIGLPPKPEEVQDFLEDESPEAYPKLVEKLLASPHYGEHWARHWLDLVRYAESDGFRIDDYRPHAWRYRDYVIGALNRDKPYDRFVAEQIAGDEIAPGDLEARVATGYLRHWLYEYNNRDVVGQWTNILNDVTDVTADVFMGLGMQCARCHDHKFDPILQKDYYRLQAFFASLFPRDDLKLATPQQEAEYAQKLAIWEGKTAELREQIAVLEAPHKKQAADAAIAKFPPETQALIYKPRAERAPLEHQLAELAYRQVIYEHDRLINKMKGADKEKLIALYRELATFDKEKPEPLPPVLAVTDGGPEAPPVRIPKKKEEEIAPGFPTLFDEKPATITPVIKDSTGRRAVLARWLTQPENPLTTRVIVNRIWQYHFGRGLVPTASDFGMLGEKPSHPELLDWLARWFVEHGWSFKQMHRLLLTSATYQQSAQSPMADAAKLKDPENRLLWRASTRRLNAEQIRDAVLAATGELDLAAGGPGVETNKPRRTIYTKVIRNTRDPLLDVFDVPEGFTSMAQRNVTTTPTQSLLMINSPWSLQRARAFAERLEKESSADLEAPIADAYRLALSRDPAPGERAGVRRFLERQSKTTAIAQATGSKPNPFVAEKMPFRDGYAALLVPGSPQDRLVVPAPRIAPGDDFTIEAFILLKSLYADGQVRTILSRWDGKRGHPGWSLGVTSKQSRYKAQTLVLLLSGDQAWSDKDPVEPVFSGLHIDLGKPYFVAVSVNLDDATEKGITFYAKDLSNDDEPMLTAQVKHTVTSGVCSSAPLMIGARDDDFKHTFDGLIDDVRISDIPLPREQLLLTSEASGEHTVGYWKFELDPGVYKDSTERSGDIQAKLIELAAAINAPPPALVDFCHVLLNSNEFLYVD